MDNPLLPKPLSTDGATALDLLTSLCQRLIGMVEEALPEAIQDTTLINNATIDTYRYVSCFLSSIARNINKGDVEAVEWRLRRITFTGNPAIARIVVNAVLQKVADYVSQPCTDSYRRKP